MIIVGVYIQELMHVKLMIIDLPCQADNGVSEVTISCSGIGPETPLQCSFDGGPLHSCK